MSGAEIKLRVSWRGLAAVGVCSAVFVAVLLPIARLEKGGPTELDVVGPLREKLETATSLRAVVSIEYPLLPTSFDEREVVARRDWGVVVETTRGFPERFVFDGRSLTRQIGGQLRPKGEDIEEYPAEALVVAEVWAELLMGMHSSRFEFSRPNLEGSSAGRKDFIKWLEVDPPFSWDETTRLYFGINGMNGGLGYVVVEGGWKEGPMVFTVLSVEWNGPVQRGEFDAWKPLGPEHPLVIGDRPWQPADGSATTQEERKAAPDAVEPLAP